MMRFFINISVEQDKINKKRERFFSSFPFGATSGCGFALFIKHLTYLAQLSEL